MGPYPMRLVSFTMECMKNNKFLLIINKFILTFDLYHGKLGERKGRSRLGRAFTGRLLGGKDHEG